MLPSDKLEKVEVTSWLGRQVAAARGVASCGWRAAATQLQAAACEIQKSSTELQGSIRKWQTRATQWQSGRAMLQGLIYFAIHQRIHNLNLANLELN